MILSCTLKRFLPSVLLVLGALGVSAQQDPQFTHYMFNQSYINAGHFGLSEGIMITGIYRNQWLGLKDENNDAINPTTISLTADAPIRMLHGGLGVGLFQDKLGYQSEMGVKLGYCYHANLPGGQLGIGLSGEFHNFKMDFSKFTTPEDEPSLSASASDGVTIADIGLGAFYQGRNSFWGISSSRLLQNKKDLTGNAGLEYNNRRHYYLTYGRDIYLPRFQGYKFTPSLLVKSDGSTLQTELNLMARYNNKVWGAVGYRLQDAVDLMIGFSLKEIEIGYAFDLPFGTEMSTTYGSHEIMARYLFRIEREKPKTGYRNTRFL